VRGASPEAQDAPINRGVADDAALTNWSDLGMEPLLRAVKR
jgi:hypothetical protein